MGNTIVSYKQFNTWPNAKAQALIEKFYQGDFDFGLEQADVERLLTPEVNDFAIIEPFKKNNVVDVLSMLCAIVFAAQGSNKEKLELLFRIFDFKNMGSLTGDEVLISLFSIVRGFCGLTNQPDNEMTTSEMDKVKTQLAVSYSKAVYSDFLMKTIGDEAISGKKTDDIVAKIRNMSEKKKDMSEVMIHPSCLNGGIYKGEFINYGFVIAGKKSTKKVKSTVSAPKCSSFIHNGYYKGIAINAGILSSKSTPFIHNGYFKGIAINSGVLTPSSKKITTTTTTTSAPKKSVSTPVSSSFIHNGFYKGIAINAGVLKTVKKVAINGFGRVGKLLCRLVASSSDLELVACNDAIYNAEYMAYQLRYDSMHKKFEKSVSVSEDEKSIIIAGKTVKVFNEKKNIDWTSTGAEIVFDTTGNDGSFNSGAKVITMTTENNSIVFGSNDSNVNSSTNKLSLANPTTQCVLPLLKAIHAKFGVVNALVTAVRPTEAGRLTVDGPVKGNWRLGRASNTNIIPGDSELNISSASELTGRVEGISMFVPTCDVSCADITIKLEKELTGDLTAALKDSMKELTAKYPNVFDFACPSTVSTDYIGLTHSCIVDPSASILLNSTFIKVVCWYDNEAAQAQRLIDLAKMI